MAPDVVVLDGFAERIDAHRVLLRLESEELVEVRRQDVLHVERRPLFLGGISDGVPVTLHVAPDTTVGFVELLPAVAFG